MKKNYDKPFAQKVAFSYEDQVVALSDPFSGGKYNRDDTKECQFWEVACNTYFNPAQTRGASTFSMYDCDKLP